MPSVQYGASAYKRTNGNFPELKLINMFVERSATSENQAALVSREGLSALYTAGAGPINGIFSKKGTFGGDIFVVSNATLYRATTSKGAITGTGPTSFAGGYNELLITRGATLHSYNGTNLAGSGFTGSSSNNVTASCFIGSVFVALEASSARFFWSAPLDGRAWDVLHFATAEREPDSLLDVAPLLNNLWLFGQQSVEVWTDTGDATARFSRIETLGYSKGIKATGCVTPADNALFFIGSDNLVYRIGEAPQRVSEHSIEERIGNSATASLFAFQYQGHEFVCVRLADETLAYDCATQEWCEFQTSQGQWIASCACTVDASPRFGHQTTNQVMDFGGWTDAGSALEHRFTAAQALDQPVPIDTVRLWANSGQTTLLIGQGSDPVVEMRVSRDAGNEWGNWRPASLGQQGQYRRLAHWTRLGMFDFPGLMMDFRLTDPVPFRVSSIKVNDPGGGRSR